MWALYQVPVRASSSAARSRYASRVLRPCLSCGYRSEPRDGGCCPECGAPSLPPSWVVIELNIPRTAKIWLVGLITVGLAGPLLMVAVGILFGANTVGIGCLGFFPILFVPSLLRSLFSRHAMGLYVITDEAIELRGAHGTTTYRAADGWTVHRLRRDRASATDWMLEIRQSTGNPPSQFEIPIDSRLDAPELVEAAARRALSPRRSDADPADSACPPPPPP